MTSLHLDVEYVPARTVSLYELYETFEKTKRINNKSDANNYKKAFSLLQECFPNQDTNSFSTTLLIEYQNYLVKRGYARKYCNKLLSFVRHIFKWGHTLGLVSATLVYSLSLVSPLPIGVAKENKPRADIAKDKVESALPFLPETIADMLKLQLLTAMRPSEVCRMRFCDINMKYDGENWLYLPYKHKGTWRGKSRAILLGLDEQNILKKYLNNELDKNIFLNKRGNPYSTDCYCKVIKKTIEKGNLPKFTSYQLRHTTITEISAEHGRDVARAIAGHSSEYITGIYDHSDLQKFKIVIESRTTSQVQNPPQLRIFTGE
jgi:integrase